MNKKELFTIKPFESLLNLQTPLAIEERPNSGQQSLKQDFNLIHNNVYIDFKDYQTFKREGVSDTRITNRGSIINQDYLQMLPKFPDENGNPFLELFKDDSGKYLNVYQESSFKEHSTFLDGISLDNNEGIKIVQDTPGGKKQTRLKMEYDSGFESDVLSFLKLPEPTGVYEESDFYQSLKVKDLFILGTTYFRNVEDLFIQDPIMDMNITQEGVSQYEQNTGFKFNQPDDKFSKLIFNPDLDGEGNQQFVLTEMGFSESDVEEYQDLYLNKLFQDEFLNSPVIHTDIIHGISDDIEITFNNIQNIGNEILINKQGNKIYINNLLESSDIKQNHVFTDSHIPFHSEQEQYYFDSVLDNIVLDKFTFLNDKLLVDSSDLNIQNSIEEEIRLNLTGSLYVSNNGIITNFIVSNNLTVQNNTGQSFTSNGFSTFNSGQEINNGLTVFDGQTLDTQEISGQIEQGNSESSSIIHGDVTIGSIGKSLSIPSEQTFGDNVIINGVFDQNDDVNLNSDNINIGTSYSTVDINGNINLGSQTKDIHFLGNVIIDGTQDLNSTFQINDNFEQQYFSSTDQDQTNTIMGDVYLSSPGKITNINGSLTVDGVQNFNDTATLDNNLYVNGNSVLGQDSEVTNTIKGDINLSNVGKTTDIKGYLDVNGISNLYGPVKIYEESFEIFNEYSSSTFSVSDTRIDNSLETYMNDDLNLLKDLIADNSLANHRLAGNVTLTTPGNNLFVQGNSNFEGNVNIEGDTELNNLSVNGTFAFNDEVNYNSTLNLNDEVNIQSLLNIPQGSVVTFGDIQIYYDIQEMSLVIE